MGRRWRQYVTPKYWYLSTELFSMKSHMIMVLNIHQHVNLKSPRFIILVTSLALPSQRSETLCFIN